MKITIEELEIQVDNTLREAMKSLDKTAEKCVFVVEDSSHKLMGALTDGDVRRAILSGVHLDEYIDGFYNPSPLYVKQSTQTHAEASALMQKHKIEVIPVVDHNGRLVDYVTWGDILNEKRPKDTSLKDTEVVIMAGGYGSRLEPFTKVLPKPLIPVHDKPIIEHIIDRFVAYGVNDFHLTVNYKSRIMKAFFHDREPDYNVSFIDEPEPLGTAGSLQYLRGGVDKAFIVTNCDIIIEANYGELFRFHREHENAITLVGSAMHHQIPYGTCVLNDSGTLERINEKPSYDFIVNTGMYVLEPEVLDLIPKTGKYHMTNLIEEAIENGNNVGVFPVSEYAWMDVGQWKEYQKTADKLEMI
jgi:dTDP-glucose pyrophosphorylase